LQNPLLQTIRALVNTFKIHIKPATLEPTDQRGDTLSVPGCKFGAS